MITLRDYQTEAVNQAALAFKTYKKILLILPTAAGKSLILASIIMRMRAKGLKVLVICHQAEILEQNKEALETLGYKGEVTYYAASLKQKVFAGVTMASRDTLGRCKKIPHYDAILCDEAHLIPSDKKSFYQKIFDRITPSFVLGCTGSPWRVKDGKIWGKDKFFEHVAYNVSLDFLTKQGFLSPHVFPKEKAVIDTSSVKKKYGDFDVKALEKVSSAEKVVNACVDRWHELAKERRCTIFFCCSLAHCQVVIESLKRYLPESEIGYIDGDSKDRAQFFKDAKAGKYKALVNMAVMTTGVNIPIIDTVCLLRATHSASLFVQAVGRGLRLAEGKKDCLIIDLAGNIERFESLSEPFIKEVNKKGKKVAKPKHFDKVYKKCPECQTELPPAAKVCSYCGEIFISHDTTVFTELVGKQKVFFQRLEESKTKTGEACFILYIGLAGGKIVKQWLLHKRANWIGQKARGIMYRIKYKNEKIAWVKIDQASKFKNVTEYGWSR